MESQAYEEWKSTVLSSANKEKDKKGMWDYVLLQNRTEKFVLFLLIVLSFSVNTKRTKQARLSFPKIARDSQDLEVAWDLSRILV